MKIAETVKMKVAYLDYSPVYGGAERVLDSMVRHLNRYRPLVIFPFPQVHHNRYTFDEGDRVYLAEGTQWWMGRDRWAHPPRGSDALARTIFGIRLVIILKKYGVRLLHVNLLRRDCMLWLLPARAVGVKIVGHWRSAATDWIPPNRVIRLCDRVVCVSDFNRRMLCEVCETERSVRIYDCIEPFHIPQEEDRELKKLLAGLSPKVRLIISVGQLTPYKGHDLAIEAFARIAIRHSDTVLLIAGGGSECERQRLNELIHKSGVGEGRILLPAIHFSDMDYLYRRAEVVLSLSHGGEAFGLVPYEAALAGRPFIGVDCGAIREFVSDGVNGLLVRDNDAEGVADRLECLLNNRGYGQRLADSLAGDVGKYLKPQVMTHQLEKLYDSLLL
ncbi:MAG: glycosyltransferase family 4 protein [Bacteroides sp.]|nr:glycosyltransferase family 4 protein [Bacteroides sp.]MDE7189021.1 glycosyltransferase family 4 protein [Muribaculaceae bacterium]